MKGYKLLEEDIVLVNCENLITKATTRQHIASFLRSIRVVRLGIQRDDVHVGVVE